MKVMLWESIEKLGEAGQIVTVKDGYARNFLIPRRMASPDGPGFRRQFDRESKKRAKIESQRIADAGQVAAKLAEVSLTIEAQTSDEGRLFGSVTPTMIAESLKDKGFIVEPRAVEIAEPIRQVGQYEVVVALHREVRPKVKLWVVSANLTLPGGEPAAGGEKASDAQAPKAE